MAAMVALAAVLAISINSAGGSLGQSEKPQASTATQTPSREALFREERGQLSDITAQLGRIDGLATGSRDQLGELILSGSDAEKMLSGLADALPLLEKNIMAVGTGLTQFAEISKNDNTAAGTALTGLLTRQQEIRELISATSQAAYALLSDTKAENQTRFAEAYDRLKVLQSSAGKMQESLDGYCKDLLAAIGLLQAENQEAHGELAEMLLAAAEEMNLLVNGQFSALQMQGSQEYALLAGQMDSLHQLTVSTGQSVTGLLAAMEEKSEGQAGGRQAEIREAFSAVRSSLGQVDASFSDAHAQLRGLIASFREAETAGHEETLSELSSMENRIKSDAEGNLGKVAGSLDVMQGSLDSAIGTMRDEMSDGLLGLQESDSSHYEKTISVLAAMEKNMSDVSGSSLSRITGSLQSLQEGFDASLMAMQDGISSQFSALRETESDFFGDTISALGLLENNVGQKADRNLARISDSLQGIQENFSTSLSSTQEDMAGSFSDISAEMGVKFTEYHSYLSKRLDQMGQDIRSRHDSLLAAVNNHDSSQQASLGILSDGIRADLQSLFQSVSNGKRNVSSALLTKGITIAEDATFAEIRQGILDIPQQLLIGVEQVPGTVSYDYHYHADSAGNELHADKCSAEGGCYSVPVYHAHAGACYKTVKYHTHNDSCPGHPEWVDWNPASPAGYWGWFYDCGNQPSNASKKELDCPRNSRTVDSYRAGCGFSDGQITGAHIVYARPATHAAPRSLPQDSGRAAADANGSFPIPQGKEAVPEEAAEASEPTKTAEAGGVTEPEKPTGPGDSINISEPAKPTETPAGSAIPEPADTSAAAATPGLASVSGNGLADASAGG